MDKAREDTREPISPKEAALKSATQGIRQTGQIENEFPQGGGSEGSDASKGTPKPADK